MKTRKYYGEKPHISYSKHENIWYTRIGPRFFWVKSMYSSYLKAIGGIENDY